jgi:hypothetical protein
MTQPWALKSQMRAPSLSEMRFWMAWKLSIWPSRSRISMMRPDVRDLVGVLAMEPDSSKGIITTTSEFAPKIYTNAQYRALMPTRLELVNGKQLQEWLVKLSK